MALVPNYDKSYYFDGSKVLCVSMAHNLGAIVALVPFFAKKVILFKADPEFYSSLDDGSKRDLLQSELPRCVGLLQ